MKRGAQLASLFAMLLMVSMVLNIGCNTDKNVRTTLYDKDLAEVKDLVKGRWELVSGKNTSEVCEFEGTFITFKGDRYIWTEDKNDEPGDLNWRKEDTGMGYDAWLMDVFYASHPSFPIAIAGDTLYIQDITPTAYRYTLIRK